MKHRLVASIVLSLSLLAASGAALGQLKGAVKIGPEEVAPAEVASAVTECSEHAPELSLKKCLESFVVPRWLVDQEVAEEVSQSAGRAHLLNDVLHRSFSQLLTAKLPEPTAKEVETYLKSHARDFNKPLRIRIFRILLDSEDEAKKLSKELGDNVNIEEFRKAAREHSVDRATNERGGDLGFVWPDGSTDVPQVKADPALYQAALPLTDGELWRAPVSEGKRHAILWRRGSLAPVLPDEDAKEIAKLRLTEKRTEEQMRSLLDELKTKHVSKRQNILLGKLRRSKATLFREDL